MKFKYTIMYVENVAMTLEFYNNAFGIETKMVHGEGDYGELETGECSLSFCSKSLMKQIGKETASPDGLRPVFEIAFETHDVQSAYVRALENGAKSVSKPEKMSWGQEVAYVTDINNYLVEICSPIYST